MTRWSLFLQTLSLLLHHFLGLYFEGSDEATVLVSPDGDNWSVVKTFTASHSDNTYHFYDIDLSAFTTSQEFWIAFDAETSGKGDKLYVDDIQIVGQP